MDNPRKYGKPQYNIVVLHGGPGALGDAAPLAIELGKTNGVLEPFQTQLTIDGLVEELKKTIDENADLPVILVGHSWGAWLGFIFTAKYSNIVRKLILISSGPFEEKYVKNITNTRLNRLNSVERSKLLSILSTLNSFGSNNNQKNKLMAQMVDLIRKADSFDLLGNHRTKPDCQYKIYRKIWLEAEKLRCTSELLKLGKQIKCPVVAIHGAYDPHPIDGVNEPLSKTLKNFKLIQLKNCGHYPWLERNAKERFLKILTKEILHESFYNLK